MANLQSEIAAYLRAMYPRYKPILHPMNRDYVEYEYFLFWKDETFRVPRREFNWVKRDISIFSKDNEMKVTIFTSIHQMSRIIFFNYT